MLTRLELSQLTVIGVSVGGIYTSIFVPEVSAIFDAGMAPRSFVGARYLFLSHGHADHVGALPALIGVRGLSRQPAPLTFLPQEIEKDIEEGLAAFNRGQRRALQVPLIGMVPEQVEPLHADLYVRSFRTLHSVPSLGFQLFRKVKKLRAEYLELPRQQIADLKQKGVDLFDTVERLELAYVTDSLIDVLDQNPFLYDSRVLILECTFLDEAKPRDETRRKFHVHLDEIVERADRFKNEHLVLMHVSQGYRPREVHELLAQRLPTLLKERVSVLCPRSGVWPG